MGMSLREALGSEEVRGWMREEIDRGVAEALVASGHGTGAGVRAAREVLEATARPRRLSRRGRECLESIYPGTTERGEPAAPESGGESTEPPPSGVVEVPAWQALMKRRGVSEAGITALGATSSASEGGA